MGRGKRQDGVGGEKGRRRRSQHTSTSNLAFLQVKTLLGMRNADLLRFCPLRDFTHLKRQDNLDHSCK